MKNSKFLGVQLALIFCTFCGSVGASTTYAQMPASHQKMNRLVKQSIQSIKRNKLIIAEKYEGYFSELKEMGYMPSGGVSVKATPSSPLIEELFVLKYCRPYSKQTGSDCVWTLAQVTARQTNGKPIYTTGDMLKLKLPSSIQLFESDDTLCKSIEYPDSHIFTVGSWRWRPAPSIGGYAHSLLRAWRIDTEAMQFREISTVGISCVINEDRN